jgi:hypothetical protein
MLLRRDFDHAATRAHLFAGCPTFAKKVVLTKRIKWFEDSTGSPSFNPCWMVWDRLHRGSPTLAYATGVSEYTRLGLARSRAPHALDPAPAPYAPTDSAEADRVRMALQKLTGRVS